MEKDEKVIQSRNKKNWELKYYDGITSIILMPLANTSKRVSYDNYGKQDIFYFWSFLRNQNPVKKICPMLLQRQSPNR